MLSDANLLITGLGKTHRKREARPLSTLLLSIIRGSAVDGWVKPHKVRQVLFISKLAFPPTVGIMKQ